MMCVCLGVIWSLDRVYWFISRDGGVPAHQAQSLSHIKDAHNSNPNFGIARGS